MDTSTTLRDTFDQLQGEAHRILVFGATGATGRALVQSALSAGHTVTAFVRDPARLDLEHTRLTPRRGDVLEPAAVVAALEGHDVVVCAIGAPARNRDRLRERGTRNIVQAMQQAGMKRLIVLSSHGIAETRAELPAVMKYLIVPFYLEQAFRDHEAQERIVRQSGLDWTLVRPAHLTDGPATGAYRRGFGPADKIKMKISRADVADFMLEQVTQPSLHEAVALSY